MIVCWQLYIFHFRGKNEFIESTAVRCPGNHCLGLEWWMLLLLLLLLARGAL
jgi:hypothetical protein